MKPVSMKDDLKLYVDIKRAIYKRPKHLSNREFLDFYEDMYFILLTLYDNAEQSKDPQHTRSWVATEIIEYMIPSMNWLSNKGGGEAFLKLAYILWNKLMALASRKSFHHFLLYMELDRTPDKQVYSNRIDVLEGIVFYLNKMQNEPKFMDLVGSFPPSYGKSFVVNYFSAWVLGNNTDGSILRLSYSDDLLNGFSRSIRGLITEQRFKDIFPVFEKFGDKPFSKEKGSDWLIKGADTLASHYTRTRDGAVTGVRAKSYIILDDMTKGADEANNDGLHEKYWDQYTTEWRNRKEDDKVKEIVIGTMWNPKDILGRKSEQLERGYYKKRSKFNYITEYTDFEGDVCGVVVRVPLLDHDMKSTCEDIYTTRTALNIMEDTDEFLFSCVYQQNPISPTGRLFAYDNLQQYEFEGNHLYHNGQRIQLSEYSFASLDPVRKGMDFVAMPIFKYDVENPHIYYMVDAMFQGKSMDEVYPEITSRVLQHNMVKLVIENNTDTSLAHLIDKNLKEKGFYSCELMEKFQTKNKEQRIRDENLPIRMQVVFPKEGMYPVNSEMGKFMGNLTKFSLDAPNKHDDAPDSIALFVREIIKEGYRGAKVEAIQRPDFL